MAEDLPAKLALRDVVEQTMTPSTDGNADRRALDRAGQEPERVAPEVTPEPTAPVAPDPLPGLAPDKPNGAEGKLTLDAIAEKAGLTLEEMYGAVVPRNDDMPPISLGDLKDIDRDTSRVGREREKLDADRLELENSQLRFRHEVEELQKLTTELPPGVAEQAKANAEAHAVDQVERFLELVPAWRNDETREAEFTAVVELAGNYSLNEADVRAVARSDHRWFKLLRDTALKEQRLAKAREEMDRTAPVRKQSKVREARAAPELPEAGSSRFNERRVFDKLLG